MNFSERLRELREKKGLSQEALSDKLNIPRSSVTNYENDDKRMPRQQRLNEIADFFGVSVDYLIGRSEKSELTEIEEKFLSDIVDLSLEEIVAKYNLKIDGKIATKEEIKAVIALIRSMRTLD